MSQGHRATAHLWQWTAVVRYLRQLQVILSRMGHVKEAAMSKPNSPVVCPGRFRKPTGCHGFRRHGGRALPYYHPHARIDLGLL